MSRSRRTRLVLRLLLLEGLANVAVLLMKLAVGLATNSIAVMADALHSMTDVANNAVAFVAVRAGARPADREHPYGHRKFEILAVFVLGVLLATVGVEIVTRALTPGREAPVLSGWGLALMLGVLVVNIAVSAWQRYWGRRLRSDILLADASHTFSDVLTTVAVIAGWQLAARGLEWLDVACALAVAAIVFFLAFRLFQHAIPVLVDQIAIEPEELSAAIRNVPGVIDVTRVRSRWIGTQRAADVIVTVRAALPTEESHEIADAVEAVLRRDFDVRDTTVHVEPHRASSSRP